MDVQNAPHVFDQRTAPAAPDAGFKLDETMSGAELTKFQKFMLFLAKYPSAEDYPRNTTGTIGLTKDRTGKVVLVHQSDEVAKVFEIFMTEGFMGAPVVNENDEYVGFIDLLDIVAFTVRLFTSEARVLGEMETFFAKSRRFRRATVGDFDVMYRPNKKAVSTLRQECSLLNVLEVLDG